MTSWRTTCRDRRACAFQVLSQLNPRPTWCLESGLPMVGHNSLAIYTQKPAYANDDPWNKEQFGGLIQDGTSNHKSCKTVQTSPAVVSQQRAKNFASVNSALASSEMWIERYAFILICSGNFPFVLFVETASSWQPSFYMGQMLHSSSLGYYGWMSRILVLNEGGFSRAWLITLLKARSDQIRLRVSKDHRCKQTDNYINGTCLSHRLGLTSHSSHFWFDIDLRSRSPAAPLPCWTRGHIPNFVFWWKKKDGTTSNST